MRARERARWERLIRDMCDARRVCVVWARSLPDAHGFCVDWDAEGHWIGIDEARFAQSNFRERCDTIAHECAHVISRDSDHGPAWERWHIRLRTHLIASGGSSR